MPKAGMTVIAVVALFPDIRFPAVTDALHHAAATDPDMAVTMPGPITRCPHITDRHHRHHFVLGRRWTYRDVEGDLRDGWRECRQQAGKQPGRSSFCGAHVRPWLVCCAIIRPCALTVCALAYIGTALPAYVRQRTEHEGNAQQNRAMKTDSAPAGLLQQAILDSTSVAIIATDDKGVIQVFNVGAERLLGYRAADMVNLLTPTHFSEPLEVMARAVVLGQECGDTVAPGFDALAYKARLGEEDSYEQTCIRQDGSRCSAMVSVSALRDAQQSIIGFLLIASDNSARKRVEGQLRAATLVHNETQRWHERLASERAAVAQYDYVAAMCQELRNPLNTMLGFAQLLASDALAPSATQADNIAQIVRAGWSQMALIDEVLDLARVESGCLSWLIEPVSLADVVHDCESRIAPLAQLGGVQVVLGKVDSAIHVSADQSRLRQVVLRLLTNAVERSARGAAVVLTIDPPSGDKLRLTVSDSSGGFSPDQSGPPRWPADAAATLAVAGPGAGFGLLVTMRLVELMGGTVGVYSTVGQGNGFWIDLPRALTPFAIPEQAETTMVAALEVPALTPLRTVLYVEDNPANLQLVEQIIARRPGLRLLSASTGALGVQMALSVRPDVVLMDINLPGMGGLEAMQLLRANPATAHIPVVAVSANAIMRDIERGLAAGFFRYLTKPIRVSEFLETLDAALELSLCAPSH